MFAGAFATLSRWFQRLLAIRAHPLLRPLLVFGVMAAFAGYFIGIPGKAPDFTVFWAAARNIGGPIYHADFITAAQAQIAPPGARPFANPPPFLLLIAPLGLLPFKPAYVLWVAGTTTFLVEAVGRIARWPWLVMVSPLFMFTALIGQSTMLVGGLLAAGFAMLPRPIIAGVLFALAACIKPQAALLTPLVLLLAGGWRPLVAFGLTAALVSAASAAVLGPHVWVEWLGSLSQIVAINDALHIPRLGSAPLWLKPVLLLAAVLLAVDGFRRGDIPVAMLATVSGALLISPHAPVYDATMLLGPALALVWRAELRSLPAAAMLLSIPIQPAIIGGFVASTAIPFLRTPIKGLLSRPRSA